MWPFKEKKAEGFVKIVIDSLKLHPHDWKLTEDSVRAPFWHFDYRMKVLRMTHKNLDNMSLIDDTLGTYGGWKIDNATIITTRNDSKLLSKAVLEWRQRHWQSVLIGETDHDKLLKEALEEVEKLTK